MRFAQLQEALKYEIMKAPAVSVASDYQTLCVAAKSKEQRLAELLRRRQYQVLQSQEPKRATSQPQVSTSRSQF